MCSTAAATDKWNWWRFRRSCFITGLGAVGDSLGAKPTIFLFHSGTAEQVAEKLGISGEIGGKHPPGLKPVVILLALCGG